jgi:hypothetical protein
MTLLCLCGTFLVDLWALSRAGTWFGLERRSAVKGARAAQFRILLAPVLVWWFLMCLGGNAGGTLVFYVVTSVLFAGGMGVSAEARTRRHFRLLAANSATPWKQLKGDDWKDWGVEPEDGS